MKKPAFKITFKGSMSIDPNDYLDYNNEEEVEVAIEEALLYSSSIDDDCLDSWDVDDEFFDEWKRLKENA